MQALQWIGGGAFVLASLVLAPRLLVLAARTRELPELLLGLTLLFGGGVGFVLTLVGRLAEPALGGASFHVVAVGFLFVTLSSACLWVFNWRVYRPGSPVAAAAALGGCAVAVAAYGYHLFVASFHHDLGTGFWFGYAGRSLAYGWASIESLRYWRLLVRRQALGLAEPLVTQRFLLWGVASASAWLLFLVNLASIVVNGSEANRDPVASFAQSLCGLSAAVGLALAFFPPAAYRRWVEGRARTHSPGAV